MKAPGRARVPWSPHSRHPWRLSSSVNPDSSLLGVSMASRPVYFTTYQVAQMLGVTLPTVVNWTKAGKLSCHRTPGGHRRISRAELVRFAGSHGVPLPPELQVRQGPSRVLLIDEERDFSEMLAEFLQLKSNVSVRICDGPFFVGLELGRFMPDLAVVNLSMAGFDPLRLARLVSEDPDLRSVTLLGVLPFADPGFVDRALAVGYAEVLGKPLSLDAVWSRVESYLHS